IVPMPTVPPPMPKPPPPPPPRRSSMLSLCLSPSQRMMILLACCGAGRPSAFVGTPDLHRPHVFARILEAELVVHRQAGALFVVQHAFVALAFDLTLQSLA